MPDTSNNARVVCPEPLAAAAGGRMLDAGGNAIDAAVATAFAQGVVNPLMTGLGGTAGALVYRADTREAIFAEGRDGAGAKARPDSYRYLAPSVYSNRYVVEGRENYLGHKAATIPTYVRVLADTHARFGHLPWATILAPAIELAAGGFAVDAYLYQTWAPSSSYRLSDSPTPGEMLSASPESARIYLRQGTVYQAGDTLRQPDYANTLQRIADLGPDEFYRGETGRAIAADFERHDGFVTGDDLERCYTRFVEPLGGTFRGDTVVTSGPPGMGQSQLQALNILECLEPTSLEWGSAAYFSRLARVFQTIYADRVRFNGDPLCQDVPLSPFLAKDRARRQANEIAAHPGPPPAAGTPAPAIESNTTHVSVVDQWGNAAAITHSNGFSSGAVTPGLGFLYNNHMHNFDARPGGRNSIAPGKKAQYGCPPIMLFRDGELALVSGSKSRFKVTADLQATLSILCFGLDVQTAVSQPRIHAEYDPVTIYAEPSVDPALLRELEAIGWSIKVITMNAPLCLIVRAEDGQWQAANDPRGGGGIWPAP